MKGSENTSDEKGVQKKDGGGGHGRKTERQGGGVGGKNEFAQGLYSRLIKNRANISHSNRMSFKVVFNWIKKIESVRAFDFKEVKQTYSRTDS